MCSYFKDQNNNDDDDEALISLTNFRHENIYN